MLDIGDGGSFRSKQASNTHIHNSVCFSQAATTNANVAATACNQPHHRAAKSLSAAFGQKSARKFLASQQRTACRFCILTRGPDCQSLKSMCFWAILKRSSLLHWLLDEPLGSPCLTSDFFLVVTSGGCIIEQAPVVIASFLLGCCSFSPIFKAASLRNLLASC